jgi:hypothetical protein
MKLEFAEVSKINEQILALQQQLEHLNKSISFFHKLETSAQELCKSVEVLRVDMETAGVSAFGLQEWGQNLYLAATGLKFSNSSSPTDVSWADEKQSLMEELAAVKLDRDNQLARIAQLQDCWRQDEKESLVYKLESRINEIDALVDNLQRENALLQGMLSNSNKLLNERVTNENDLKFELACVKFPVGVQVVNCDGVVGTVVEHTKVSSHPLTVDIGNKHQKYLVEDLQILDVDANFPQVSNPTDQELEVLNFDAGETEVKEVTLISSSELFCTFKVGDVVCDTETGLYGTVIETNSTSAENATAKVRMPGGEKVINANKLKLAQLAGNASNLSEIETFVSSIKSTAALNRIKWEQIAELCDRDKQKLAELALLCQPKQNHKGKPGLRTKLFQKIPTLIAQHIIDTQNESELDWISSVLKRDVLSELTKMRNSEQASVVEVEPSTSCEVESSSDTTSYAIGDFVQVLDTYSPDYGITWEVRSFDGEWLRCYNSDTKTLCNLHKSEVTRPKQEQHAIAA